MGSLTIKELKELKSTNNEIIKKDLIGTFSLITTENLKYERGTLLLTDEENKFIPCRVDLFYPQLLDRKVIIKRWSYTTNQHVQWLEFQLTNVYDANNYDVSSMLSLMVYLSELDFHRLKPDQKFYKPCKLLESVDLEQPINIAGVVCDISILYFKQNTPTTFFIQLIDSDCEEKERVKITIMFGQDELIKYHSFFQLGAPYTFQNLKLKWLGGKNRRHRQPVFSFIDQVSDSNIITPHRYSNNLSLAVIPEDQSLSSLYPSLTIPYRQTPNSNYTGIITRVVDPLFGIYELDNQLLLCLFHHLAYTPQMPYRLHTKLKLHDVHPTYISPKDNETSHLFSSLWKAPLYEKEEGLHYFVLVACMKSHIDVVDFSKDLKIPPQVELSETQEKIKSAIYLDCLEQPIDFTTFIRKLEIYATLLYKFNQTDLLEDPASFKTVYRKIKSHVFSKKPIKHRRRDYLDDFFLHPACCSTLQYPLTDNTLYVTIDAYPFLNKIVERLESKLERYHLDLPGFQENPFETGHVHTELASYSSLQDPYYILGQLKTSSDGRLFLSDSQSQQMLSISDSSSIVPIEGDFYFIPLVQLVNENLSFTLTPPNQQTLSSHYLICQGQDLVRLLPPALYFRSNIPLDPTIARYQPTSPLATKHLTVIHVLDRYPIQTSFKAGQLYLESRLIVQAYPIEPNRTPHKHILILSSLDQTLKHYPSMTLGTRWIIKSPLQRHLTSPIPFLTADRGGLELEPVFGPAQPDTILSQVRDLAEPGPVHVRGLVVGKRFGEGPRPTHDPLDPLELYSRWGIGTGKRDRKIYLQLRQLDGLETIDLYLDPRHIHYPLGVLVGSSVTIYHLDWRGGYGVANENSLVVVERHQTDDLADTRLPTRLLSSFFDQDLGKYICDDKIFKVLCSIQEVLSVRFRWDCEGCGSVLRQEGCDGLCQAPRVFVASAFVQVADGTASAHVNLEGERLVFKLFRLSPRQASDLKEAVLKGPVVYGQWAHDPEEHPALRGLLERIQGAGHFWLFGKGQASKKRKAQDTDYLEQYHLQKVSISDNRGLLRTLTYKKLKIKAVELEFPESRILAYEILNQLENS